MRPRFNPSSFKSTSASRHGLASWPIGVGPNVYGAVAKRSLATSAFANWSLGTRTKKSLIEFGLPSFRTRPSGIPHPALRLVVFPPHRGLAGQGMGGYQIGQPMFNNEGFLPADSPARRRPLSRPLRRPFSRPHRNRRPRISNFENGPVDEYIDSPLPRPTPGRLGTGHVRAFWGGLHELPFPNSGLGMKENLDFGRHLTAGWSANGPFVAAGVATEADEGAGAGDHLSVAADLSVAKFDRFDRCPSAGGAAAVIVLNPRPLVGSKIRFPPAEIRVCGERIDLRFFVEAGINRDSNSSAHP